eukprot:COSAG05_NODE_17272_length_328_cov_1.052402_1_plen_35_part_01
MTEMYLHIDARMDIDYIRTHPYGRWRKRSGPGGAR